MMRLFGWVKRLQHLKRLSRVRDFIKNNRTIYCSTHCPEGYLNIEQHKIAEL